MDQERASASRHRSGGRPAVAGEGRRPLGRVLQVAGPAISLVLPVASVLVMQAASPLGQRVPTGTARFDLAASWLAAAPDALTGATSWLPGLLVGRVQLGLLLRLLQAAGDQSVLGAAQAALLLLAALQTALLWWLLRRTGRGAVAAGLAAAAFGVAPAAIAAHATVSAASIAVAWLLVAGLLATVPGRTAAVCAGAAAVLAVASQPLAALPVAVAVAALVAAQRRGAVRPAPGPWLPGSAFGAVLAAAALSAVAVVSASLPPTAAARALDAVVAAQPGPVLGAAAPLAWLQQDPLGLVVALLGVVAAARRPAGRAVAAAAVLVLAASCWPAGADAAGPLVVLLPVTALAVAATLDAAVAALGDPVFRRSLIGSGWLTGVAALLLVAVVVSLSSLTALVPASAGPVARTQRWLAGSVPAGQTVLVGLGAWPDLQSASRARVAWYAARGTAAAPASSAPWSQADYVVADAVLAAGTGGAARAVLRRSVLVAGFGAGADRLAVRAVRGGASSTPSSTPTPEATQPSEAQQQAAAARALAGRQLSGNSRIQLDGADRALLLAGRVDTRIALVLAQFSTGHRLTVQGFGTAAGDRSGVRTTVLISAVDGRGVPDDVEATGELLRFLSALRGDFATRSIDSGTDGVTAGFAPDSEFVPSS